MGANKQHPQINNFRHSNQDLSKVMAFTFSALIILSWSLMFWCCIFLCFYVFWFLCQTPQKLKSWDRLLWLAEPHVREVGQALSVVSFSDHRMENAYTSKLNMMNTHTNCLISLFVISYGFSIGLSIVCNRHLMCKQHSSWYLENLPPQRAANHY